MTRAQALASIYERYTEDELLHAKDEPDTDFARGFVETASVITLFRDAGEDSHATRQRVKTAFADAGHGRSPCEALANARRIFRQD